MGYCSTFNIYSFKVEDCQKAKEIFQRYIEDDPLGCFFYELKILNPQTGQVTIVPENGEYTAKHYADERLAKAISEVIAPGETVDITFDGEDGTKWGYKISKNKVLPLTCEFLTQDEQDLLNTCLNTCKIKDINAEEENIIFEKEMDLINEIERLFEEDEKELVIIKVII